MTTYTIHTQCQGEQQIIIRKPPFEKIGLFISGGLDSSLLLELYVREQVNVTPYHIDRGEPLEYDAAMRVVEKINEIHNLDLTLEKIQIPLDPEGNGDLIKGKEILADKVECMIVGDNMRPPSDVTTVTRTTIPWRLPVSQQFDYPDWELPFLHVDKSYLVKLILDLRCEWIFDLSRSCAEYYINYEDELINQGKLRCETCFNCKERAWAFQSVGIADPGLE